MKSIARMLVCVFVVAALLCVTPFAVEAGISPVNVADNSGFQDSLDSGKWYFREVNWADGNIVFDETSNDSSRIVSRIKINNLQDYGYELCFEAETEVCIESIPQGVRFGVMFGLSIPSDYPQADGSTFVWFTGSPGAIEGGVSVFRGGEENVAGHGIIAETAGELKINIAVKTDGTASVLVNGGELLQENVKVSTEGYFGFGSTGTVSARVKSVKVDAFDNSTPENAQSIEDFSKPYNANVWYSQAERGAFPDGGVYRRSDKLEFDRAPSAWISTKYDYSNFELAFDLSDVAGQAVFDEEGTLVCPVSTAVAVAFGGSSHLESAGNMYRIEFSPEGGTNLRMPTHMSVKLYEGKTMLAEKKIDPHYNFWAALSNGDNAAQVKVSMTDGALTVKVKYFEEKRFTTLFSHDLGFTPEGVVQIVSSGTGKTEAAGAEIASYEAGSFCIDNLMIANKDFDKRIIAIEYRGAEWDIPEDYAYEDTWQSSDLLGGAQ